MGIKYNKKQRVRTIKSTKENKEQINYLNIFSLFMRKKLFGNIKRKL